QRDIPRPHDVSPGYMVAYRPVRFLALGAGAVRQHGLPLTSDKLLTPKSATEDRFSKSTGRPITGDTSAVNPCRDGDDSDCDYYSFKGFKTMARASLDLGNLFGFEAAQTGDFKLYTELALLGVEK